MRKKTSAMSIGELLGSLCRDRQWDRRLGLYSVFGVWNEAVGPEVAAHARPVLLRGDVLRVQVSDSAWMYQLQMQKRSLLAEINRRLSGGVIADLRFELAKGPLVGAVEMEPVVGRRPVDPGAERRLDKLLAAVDDDRVRAAMKQLWFGCRPEDEK